MQVLITGANRGVGQALAALYRDAGHAVIGTARDGSGDEMLDVTDPGQQAALGKRLEGQPIDLLICNAGVYLDKGQKLDSGFPADMWAREFAVNVTGVFLTVQALLPNLRLAKDAKIAIISSQMASHERAPGGSYIYRASKAAALNLGRNLSSDLKREGIAVGIYHPGWVQTDMGGAEAAITVEESAEGLLQRLAALGPATSGVFETYQGEEMPF